MIYTLENDYLKIGVTTWGAQLCSVVRKCDGVEHMWQADKSVWGYHAPILFPYTGKLVGGRMVAKDQSYEGGQHGFARLMEHTLVRQTEDQIVLKLTDSHETLGKWPYRFCLRSTFTLEGDSVRHTLTVENRDAEVMPFGIGYHPAFAIPFDDRHTSADYAFRFDTVQSPMCIDCLPDGLVNGKCYYYASNIREIPLTEQLFANDSYCMAGLTAKTLGIYEKDTGRGVECSLEGFPYTLIWSKPNWPTPFVCIEPWMSLPGVAGGSQHWDDRSAAAVLEPGQSWSVELKTRFVR